MSTFWEKSFNSKEKVRHVGSLLKAVFQSLLSSSNVPSLSPPTHSSQGILEMRGSLCPQLSVVAHAQPPLYGTRNRVYCGITKRVGRGGGSHSWRRRRLPYPGCYSEEEPPAGLSCIWRGQLPSGGSVDPLRQGARVIVTHTAPWNAKSLN